MLKQKVYRLEVIEVRHVRCLYKVKASSYREAVKLAQEGATIEEKEIKTEGVQHREVVSEPELMES